MCFCHENKRAFFFSPWLPQKWSFQAVYLVYRWLIMLYFLVWLVVTIVHAVDSIKFKYFIFLTHWGFMAWNGYLVMSTIAATAAALSPNSCRTKINQDCPKKFDTSNIGSHTPAGCCKANMDSRCVTLLEICFKLEWALFLIGGEYALVITILYWVMYADPNSGQDLYSLDSLNLHMINGIFALVELWCAGIPVRVCHAVYSIAFGCVYILFTGLYYAAGGLNPEGKRFIYPFLDYGSNAKAAVVWGVSCAVFLVGGTHFLFFLQYKGRKYITDKIYSTTKSKPHATAALKV